MLVKNWMSKPVITIDTDATLKLADELLNENEIHILPVLKNDQLVGVVTDKDVKAASPSEIGDLLPREAPDFISRAKVQTVMTKNPVTVPYNYTIEETAMLLFVHNISGAPVVNQVGKLIGVITKTDIFKVIISLTGISKKGIQLAFKVKERPEAIKEITDLIQDYGGRIASVLSTQDRVQNGYLNVYIRVYGVDSPGLQRIKEVCKEKARLLYIVDHEQNSREIL